MRCDDGAIAQHKELSRGCNARVEMGGRGVTGVYWIICISRWYNGHEFRRAKGAKDDDEMR